MKAMLLTAGFGKRMFPLALTQPKPSIPVLGRPMVVQVLHWLGLKGVDEAVLNLHHLPDGIRCLLGDGENPGLPAVRYSHEDQLLGTAGGIRKAAPALIGDGPIVVTNADFLSDIDLAAALEHHERSGCLATLVLVPARPGYSVVLRENDGSVLSIAGVPRVEASHAGGEWLFTGCHIIDEALIGHIPSDGPRCMVRDVYQPLAAEGHLGSYVHEGFWWEFGSPELYLDGCLRLLAEPPERLKLISTEHDPLRQLGDAVAAVGPGAGFDDDVQFGGKVALGFSSFISERSRIEDSVVMPEAWIGPRCRLKRSVIGQGVELPAGFEGAGLLVCLDPDPALELPPTTRRRAGLLFHNLATAAA